jgi:predicted transcriptional regulator of viral defense system
MAFSLDEVRKVFPDKPDAQIKNALGRLVNAGKVQSVWRGYYAIIRPDYGRDGVAPPIEYIDSLMTHLGIKYYVALLNAADLHGAAHQKPQTFTFISDHVLHPKTKRGVKLSPVLKRHFPKKYITKMNVMSGSINVSSPELTSIDLLMYPEKSGGPNNIATVLGELAEIINYNNVDEDFFDGIPAGAVQRLGFLLDEVLREDVQANILFVKAYRAGVHFRKRQLVNVPSKEDDRDLPYNKRWKIIVNYEVETDI